MNDLVLGVDGGGTGCRAAVAAARGPILGEGISGPANILTDPERAVNHIYEASLAALGAAGLPVELIGALPALLGLAGNNAAEAVNRITGRLPFARAVIHSDGLIALQGAFGPGNGALASLGTGTVYLQRVNGAVRQFGGWGFLIGDGGSGARIGQEALRGTLLAHDGVRPMSGLAEDLMARFAGEPGRMLDFARHATPGDFAAFAPDVFAAAGRGDPLARAVIRQAVAEIDEVLDHMLSLSGPIPLCLRGGLRALHAPFLAERHRLRLVEPAGDALEGAISLACSTFLATEAVN